MREKIANALKTKYANLGLSEKAFNGVASFLEKTITDETAIESAIAESSVVNFLKDIQSEQDRLRGERSTAMRALEEYKRNHPDGGASADHSNDDANANAIADLQRKIEQLTAGLAEKDRLARAEGLIKGAREKMKSSGSDNDFILGITLNNAEVRDEDTIESLAARYKSVYDSNYKAAYGDGVIPPRSTPKAEGYKEGNYRPQIEALQKEGVIPKSTN